SGQAAAIAGVASRAEAIELQTIAVEQSRFGIPLLFTSKDSGRAKPLWPDPLAMAASWDPDAVWRLSRVLAHEATARGWSLVATPPVRLLAGGMGDPQASFGAEVHLAERIACSLLGGLQGESPASIENVLGLLCYGPLAATGPERHATEQLIRAILRKSDLAAIEEMHAARGAGEEAVSSIHSSFAGIDLGAWRRLARLSATQTDETDRRAITSGMDRGYLSPNTIDEAVRRVLAAKSDLGLFRDPFLKLGPAAEPSPGAALAGRAARDDLARKSMVLLRNENELLPLARDSGKLLVVGTGREATAGLRRALNTFGIEHSTVAGLALRAEDGTNELASIGADGLSVGMACDAATRSAVVLMVITDADCEPIENSLALRPGAAAEVLLRALVHVNPRLALIESTRLPLDLGDLATRVGARLLAWSGSDASDDALAEVLTGQVNPTGRLPLALETADRTASLPFGHGLGYARVAYSEMDVELGADRVIAQITLRNLGEDDCVETVLLYLRGPSPRIAANSELRCFQRVELAAGETQRVQFELGLEELGEIGPDGRVALEPGSYEILLGRDAAHLSGREVDLQASMIRTIAGFSRGARLRAIGF
ncbi:MAG: glycoside hydrolase family 3 C-terminal domain-containing protein, partial [Alphaproteobacteria bacterium]|nr:glycoside hydrolase family 3 C-terminal domain-containing protein [Alphaproteobacteria bacterium]